MKHRIAICVGLMALGVAPSAQAQGYYGGPPRVYIAPMFGPGIPPGEVLVRVRAAGLSPLTQPARRGPRYVLLASDHMGGQLRVFVNAYDGRIVRVMPAYDPRFAYHPVRPQAMVPVQPPQRYSGQPELKDPPAHARTPRSTGSITPPAPTDAAPNHRLASTPPAADPTPPRPARTPLPRPRPAVAAKETSPEARVVGAADTAGSARTSAREPTPATTQSRPAAPPPTETKLVPVAPLD